MVIRNSWVTQDRESAGFYDSAEFEKVKRTGTANVHRWINEQMENTSVTVVLIGSQTLSRPFVQYEICHSLARGNALIGVYVNHIKDMRTGFTSMGQSSHMIIGQYDNGRPAYFDEVCDGIYDYVYDNGYDNLGNWIEAAARQHGK